MRFKISLAFNYYYQFRFLLELIIFSFFIESYFSWLKSSGFGEIPDRLLLKALKGVKADYYVSMGGHSSFQILPKETPNPLKRNLEKRAEDRGEELNSTESPPFRAFYIS